MIKYPVWKQSDSLSDIENLPKYTVIKKYNNIFLLDHF